MDQKTIILSFAACFDENNEINGISSGMGCDWVNKVTDLRARPDNVEMIGRGALRLEKLFRYLIWLLFSLLQ